MAAKLTGTMGGDQFEQPIQNGEIHGDDISFTVHLEFGDGIDLKYTGKVAPDKIDFKVQRAVTIRRSRSLPRRPNRCAKLCKTGTGIEFSPYLRNIRCLSLVCPFAISDHVLLATHAARYRSRSACM